MDSDQTVSEFFAWLASAIRDRFRDKKIAAELAAFLECDERSACRYLAGQRFPSGPQMVRFFEDDVLAPQIVGALLERLPADRRAKMAKALIDAAELVKMASELEALEMALAAKRAAAR